MVNRVGGLVSGMDIDELVKKLMSAEKAPLNKLYQKKQTYEWQRDAYRSVNTKLKTFDTYIADNLILKTLNSKTASSSNSNLVSATALGSATGTLSIEGVSQLATPARGVGSQINADGNTKLSTLFNGAKMPSTIKLSAIDKQGKLANDVSIEITENMTVSQFVNKINSSSAGVNAIFEGGKLSITAKNTGREVNGGAAITTDKNGSDVFAKLGLTKLVTEEGKNAVFQVNGIATERTTNSFTINGYNITLNSTFNSERATAEKYNAALTEWKNTTSTDFKDIIDKALDNIITAAEDYNTSLIDYNKSKNSLFGLVEVSTNETNAFNKVYGKLTSQNLETISQKANFNTEEEYTTWLNSTSDSELKTKLKEANISYIEFNALKTLDAEKINSINKQAAFNTIGSSFINGLSDVEKELILGLENPKTLEKFNEQIETWKNSDSEAEKALGTKLAKLSDTQKTTLINTSKDDLTDFSKQAAYNTLGVAFLGNLTGEERTLLKNGGTIFTAESLNVQIEEWKKGNESEKALAEKLQKLSDSQKATLIKSDLSSLSQIASDYLDSQAKLKIKNTTEAEHQALVDRKNKAEVDFKSAYQMQFNSALPTDSDSLEKLSAIDANSIQAATSPVTLSSTTNVDDMMTKIKEFVNTYNGFIKDLTAQTKETKYRDYPPLTDEQKEDLSENEIKLWEEKAKSGLLRNDALIREGLSNMRSLIYQSNPAIDSKYNTLFSIGITTSKNYNDGGTLEIDEAKLRKVLEEDPDAVEKLFKNSEGKEKDLIEVQENGKTVTKEVDTRGFLYTLRSSMKVMEINIEKKAGRSTMTDAQYVIGKNLIDAEKRIATWKTKLENIEARYWKQFTAMETAINKANSQSSIFSTE